MTDRPAGWAGAWPSCDGRYESHAWAWTGGRLACGACGLEDLDARRVWVRVLAGLRRLGVPVQLLLLLVR